MSESTCKRIILCFYKCTSSMTFSTQVPKSTVSRIPRRRHNSLLAVINMKTCLTAIIYSFFINEFVWFFSWLYRLCLLIKCWNTITKKNKRKCLFKRERIFANFKSNVSLSATTDRTVSLIASQRTRDGLNTCRSDVGCYRTTLVLYQINFRRL